MDDRWFTDYQPSGRRPPSTRANAGEVVPSPVNVGGQISHVITVRRELGLPCVASVEGATDKIPDRAVVEVDGSNGRVTIQELP